MHTVIHIDDLPPALREKAIKLGERQGPYRLVIETRLLRSLSSCKKEKLSLTLPAETFNVALRPPEEIDAILEICSTCDRFSNGRCSLCRACGSTREVKDFARLTTHHCPLKPPKW